VLWAVLAINGAMFLIEIIAGVAAGSHRCRQMHSTF
jgi:Co/Zn/Cd efflux system component